MRRLINYFVCFVIVLCTCSQYTSAETILEIIPSESAIEFDNEVLNNTDPSILIKEFSFDKILILIFDSIKEYLPEFSGMLASILFLVLFFVLMDRFSFTKNENSYRFVISCLASSVLTLFLVSYFSAASTLIEKNLETIRVFCDASIPIISMLLIEGGSNFSSAVFSYGVSTSGAVISGLNEHLFMPLIRIFLAIGCCGCIWEDVDFSAITDMIQKFIKWMIGLVFSVFTFTLSLQNVLAGSSDNVTRKVLKTAAGSVPYMGSVLSEGLDGAFALAAGTKNISSIIGIVVIISIFIGPALMVFLQSLALYFAISAAGFFGQKDCLSILKTVHKAYLLMLGLFLVSALMCVICFLVICLGANR